MTLYCDAALKPALEELGDELRFVLITSEARVLDLDDAPAAARETDLAGLKIDAQPSAAEKCERCWHRRDDVGAHADRPTLCGRCVSNVDGPGEERHFA